MTTIEIVLAVLLAPTTGLVIRQALRNRKHARNNAAMVERTDREADAAEAVAREGARAQVAVAELQQVPGLIDKIDKLWAEKDECKEALRSLSDARAKDAEACREETTSLRSQLARMAEVTAATRASVHGEDTGVTDLRALAAEVRRRPTPPEPMPAHPDPHSALSGRPEIPPPKRGKE